MLNSVPVEKIKAFEVAFLAVMESKHADVLEALRKGAWGDQEIATIEAVAKDVLPGYTA
jgi:F-type H+-transporting ATPase subunit alpha